MNELANVAVPSGTANTTKTPAPAAQSPDRRASSSRPPSSRRGGGTGDHEEAHGDRVMKPWVETVLRSPAGFFIHVTVQGGESFVAQVVRPAREGETTMRVRRLGRPSELVHLADVIDARQATRADITSATTANEDSTAVHEDGRTLPMVGGGISSSSCLPVGTSDEKKDGSR